MTGSAGSGPHKVTPNSFPGGVCPLGLNYLVLWLREPCSCDRATSHEVSSFSSQLRNHGSTVELSHFCLEL